MDELRPNGAVTSIPSRVPRRTASNRKWPHDRDTTGEGVPTVEEAAAVVLEQQRTGWGNPSTRGTGRAVCAPMRFVGASTCARR